jgi:hypothetical protein
VVAACAGVVVDGAGGLDGGGAAVEFEGEGGGLIEPDFEGAGGGVHGGMGPADEGERIVGAEQGEDGASGYGDAAGEGGGLRVRTRAGGGIVVASVRRAHPGP